MPGTTGGLNPFTLVSAATTNPTQINPGGGPCQLVALSVGNVNAAARYVKFYDTAVTPTSGFAGTSATLNFIVPGNTAGAGSNVIVGASTRTNGFQFNNGLAMQITANIAIADMSAVSAGDVVVNIGWR